MQEQIGNTSWSVEDNENFQLILSQLPLNKEQIYIIQQQIKNLKIGEKAINCLLECDQNWTILQQKIKQELILQSLEQQQQGVKAQEQHINKDEVDKLEKQLLQQMKSKNEVNYALQYIKSANLNQDVLNNVLESQFESYDELQSLIQIFSEESRIASKRNQFKIQMDNSSFKNNQNQGYNLIQGSNFNQGNNFYQGSILNQGNNFNQGSNSNQGNNFNYGSNLNQGKNLNYGNNLNQGNNLNYGNNLNQGNNLNYGSIMNQGNNFNYGSNINQGKNFNFGSNINYGNNFNFGSNINQGNNFNFGGNFNQGCSFNSGIQLNQGNYLKQGNSFNLGNNLSQGSNLNQQNQGNNTQLQVIQQIQELFSEFQSLNHRNNQQLQNQLIQLYSSFSNQQKLPQVNDFTTSPQIEYEDLVYLSVKVKQNFTYYPRPVQILSVIELYSHNNNKGRLAQIYTGEGKTLIVAMLAILLCKKKRLNVDIVTSSPVLAVRDVKELKSFYQLFSVSVSHNINGASNQKEKQYPCYDSQVIYGDSHSFQADILRHEYSELGTMGNRKQEYIIIDEVDSMLIDGNSNKTLLSTPIPGMLDLTKVLTLIWDEICKAEPNLSTEMKIMISEENNYYSVDLSEYIEATINLQLKETLLGFIPKFRLNYIDFMKQSWIKSAIEAKFYLHEKQHYIIDNNNVRIIDYQNTGVVHKDNMQWQKGLHQFIQLKHNLSITPLRICTNYISNVSYFQRYKNLLLGLTGTLGSNITQNLLAKQYNVDFVFMPPYKKRLLQIEPGTALMSEQEWLDEILKAVQQQIYRRRAVLIINQTIKDVIKIENYLKTFNLNSITYVDDSQEIQKDIEPKTIIIATNLAGRGTDLSTNKELEINGGLHVIMSFLPRNIRIQLQGFGRTARQGKQGTAELIVNFTQNLYCGNIGSQLETFQDAINYYKQHQNKQDCTYLEVLIYFRDLNEQQYSDEIELEMKKLLNEDKCFQKFCQIAKGQVNIKQNKAAFQALEEKWGLYLEQFQDEGLNENDIEQCLNSDEGQNPKYLILQGLEKENVNMLKKAAQMNQQDPQAQYYQGIYEIKQNDYQSGIKSLQNAKMLFQRKIDDEKGFAAASKLNRVQVDQFQDNNSLLNLQKSEIQPFKENLEFPSLDLTGESEIENISVTQFVDQNKQQQNFIDSKINNHIKVYQKMISNIDDILNTLQNFNSKDEVLELKWQNTIEKDEKQNDTSEQSIKDQQEVIQDGPLPKIGKLTKKKIQKNRWKYISMFALGLGQFVVGCAICAYTCGLALPLGRTLATQGIRDMLLAVTAAWKGIDIDWGKWGKNKVIQISTSLALAGFSVIEDALHLGSLAWKSLQSIGIGEFLKQIPAVTIKGLKNAGLWLTNIEKVNIQGQYDTLKLISEGSQTASNHDQILNLAQQVVQDQQNMKIISNESAQDLLGFVKQCFQQSQGSADQFKKIFFQLAKNYIRLQMAKRKQKKNQKEQEQDIIEICQREGNKKFNNIKNDIEQYNQYEKALTNELQTLSKIILQFYSQDQEIQKMTILLDIFYEFRCDPNTVQQIITNERIQDQMRRQFSIQNKAVQMACNQLQIGNPQSMQAFNENIIRPRILKCCSQFNSQKYSEPLEVVFEKEYLSQYEAQLQQIKQQNEDLNYQQVQIKQISELIKAKGNNVSQLEINQINMQIHNFNAQTKQFEYLKSLINDIEKINYRQLTETIIAQLKINKLINDDGITFSPQFQQEFNHFLNTQNYNQVMKEILLQAMYNSYYYISKSKLNSKRIMSSKLVQAIEIEIIEEIKKYIFETRMQIADKKILSKID